MENGNVNFMMVLAAVGFISAPLLLVLAIYEVMK